MADDTVKDVSPAPAVSPEAASPSVQATDAPKVAESAPVEQKPVETLLASDKKIEEAKPEEKAPEAKAEEAKPEEKSADAPKIEEKSAEPPAYEIKIPDGVTVDDSKFGEFKSALAEFELKSKAPHEEVQALGQQMMEKYLGEMQRYNDSLVQAWNKQKNDWKESFLKDPEFTNRTNTVLNAAIDVIDTYAGTKEQAKEFRDLMESTGVGNHPAVIRLLSNIKLAKPEPKQLAAPQIAPKASTSKIQKMYGSKKN